jgi:hypothetical protein
MTARTARRRCGPASSGSGPSEPWRVQSPRRALSRIEAALYLGISPSKFDELRKDGRVGPARLIDGRKVWDVRELDLVFEAFPLESNDGSEDWTATL